MKIECEVGGRRYRADTEQGVSLAIPLVFDGPQPRFFGAAGASARAMRAPGFEGDTKRGGSCNVSELSLNPHCNGTHTESVWHVAHEGGAAYEVVQILCSATLVSVTPSGKESTDTGSPSFRPKDRVIDRASLEAELRAVDGAWLEALVVRTLPNALAKTTANYGSEHQPPFFTREAAAYLRERGVLHWLVDVPSLDRMDDAGLTAHHVFFGLVEGSHELPPGFFEQRSVTELCFVPDSTPDGAYLLNLQLPAFELDAAPSRPVLLPVEPR